MVKLPIPGRTRFFRIEVDVADAETTRMRADSKAFWPAAAHKLGKISFRKPQYRMKGKALTEADGRTSVSCCLVAPKTYKCCRSDMGTRVRAACRSPCRINSSSGIFDVL